jgi:hypothetical protein
VEVEHVLCLLVRATAAVDQQLLDDEARRVRHEHVQVPGQADSRPWPHGDDPGRDQQQLEVPQLLRGDPGLRQGGVGSATTLALAAVERGQELHVEPGIGLAEVVMGDCRGMVPQQLLPEPRLLQRSSDVTGKTGAGRKGQIGIARAQGQVGRWVGQRMEPVKPVGPATDDDQVTQPGPEGAEQAGERREVVHLRPFRR